MGSSHPDADLYPRATGAAAKLVEAHSKEEPLKLYSGWFCPYVRTYGASKPPLVTVEMKAYTCIRARPDALNFVQRAWLVLEEKQMPYQYIEINPYHKEKSFLQLNPRGLVPTLGCPQKDGSSKPLYESNIICEYLDETSPAPSLYPTDKYQKARMKIWIDHITSRIIPAFHRFLQHTKDSPYSLDAARVEFLGHLKTWIKEADPTGPYFAGEQFSMADVALAPWAVRSWVFDHFKDGGLGMPEKGRGDEDEAAWERWRVWVRAIQGRKSVQETMSEREHYLPIYTRYAEDRAQSELAKATRKGRGVP